MSLETFLKPLLYNKSEDMEWYVKATHSALNSYMLELETSLSKPNQQIAGATVVPSVPPVTVSVTGQLVYFIPNGLRLDYKDVKDAMWCGDGRQCFINLFNLFGSKFVKNFVNLGALPIVEIIARAKLSAASFEVCANEMIDAAIAIGTNMNPDKFVELESNYLSKAIATIPPICIITSGAGLIPTGSFNGTIEIDFSKLGV